MGVWCLRWCQFPLQYTRTVATYHRNSSSTKVRYTNVLEHATNLCRTDASWEAVLGQSDFQGHKRVWTTTPLWTKVMRQAKAVMRNGRVVAQRLDEGGRNLAVWPGPKSASWMKAL